MLFQDPDNLLFPEPAPPDRLPLCDLLPAFWTTPGEDFLIISRAGRGEKDHEGF